MASSRTINSPGIELREIDRSQYTRQDNSLPNAPTVLVTGVADHGENYFPQWINTNSTFIDKFGKPSTTEENYFYTACSEILKMGGICIACKLPYDNIESQNGGRFSFCDYIVDTKVKDIGDYDKIELIINKIKHINESLVKVLKTVHKYEEYQSRYNLQKMSGMHDAIESLLETYDLPVIETHNIKTLKAKLLEIAEYLNEHGGSLNELKMLDSDLMTYVEISSSEYGRNGVPSTGTMSIADLDNLKTGSTASIRNHIRIVDISRSRHTKTDFNSVKTITGTGSETKSIQTNDSLGIFPVITTATNAIYFQNLFASLSANIILPDNYNPINKLSCAAPTSDKVIVDLNNLSSNIIMKLNDAKDSTETTVSKIAVTRFSPINFRSAQRLDPTHLKHIGIVVLKAFADVANSNMVNFQVLESFVGSLDKNERSEFDNSTVFIDNIVNSNSQYINVFSNVDQNLLKHVSILHINNQKSHMLGFFEAECEKTITVDSSAGTNTTIIQSLNRIFDICKDPNQLPLDIIVDAGISNIAQYYESLSRSGKDKDDFIWQLNLDPATLSEQTSRWKHVIKKFNDFCQYTRQDCMFIADGLRPFCLIGNEKIVRPTKIGSSVEKDILPFIKHIVGINSSYSAGYCNWFKCTNDMNQTTADAFWCPPSIRAADSYIYCDTYFHTWDAPAGLTRGIVDAIDVAFNPTKDEAGKIYLQNWNYAVSYPLDGIILEGQKTFQTTMTALDRVNVRRLLLKLEKQVTRAAKFFLYEGNTEYIRQKFVDSIRPYFEKAVSGNGIAEYAIKCDNELNTPEVIDNNELRCKIAIRPVKTIEFIVISLITTSQSASVTEEVMK